MTRLDISSVANASLPAVPCSWKHTHTRKYLNSTRQDVLKKALLHLLKTMRRLFHELHEPKIISKALLFRSFEGLSTNKVHYHTCTLGGSISTWQANGILSCKSSLFLLFELCHLWDTHLIHRALFTVVIIVVFVLTFCLHLAWNMSHKYGYS